MIKITKTNKKGIAAQTLVRILLLIIIFATIGAGIIYLLRRYGVI